MSLITGIFTLILGLNSSESGKLIPSKNDKSKKIKICGFKNEKMTSGFDLDPSQTHFSCSEILQHIIEYDLMGNKTEISEEDFFDWIENFCETHGFDLSKFASKFSKNVEVLKTKQDQLDSEFPKLKPDVSKDEEVALQIFSLENQVQVEKAKQVQIIKEINKPQEKIEQKKEEKLTVNDVVKTDSIIGQTLITAAATYVFNVMLEHITSLFTTPNEGLKYIQNMFPKFLTVKKSNLDPNAVITTESDALTNLFAAFLDYVREEHAKAQDFIAKTISSVDVVDTLKEEVVEPKKEEPKKEPESSQSTRRRRVTKRPPPSGSNLQPNIPVENKFNAIAETPVAQIKQVGTIPKLSNKRVKSRQSTPASSRDSSLTRDNVNTETLNEIMSSFRSITPQKQKRDDSVTRNVVKVDNFEFKIAPNDFPILPRANATNLDELKSHYSTAMKQTYSSLLDNAKNDASKESELLEKFNARNFDESRQISKAMAKSYCTGSEPRAPFIYDPLPTNNVSLVVDQSISKFEKCNATHTGRFETRFYDVKERKPELAKTEPILLCSMAYGCPVTINPDIDGTPYAAFSIYKVACADEKKTGQILVMNQTLSHFLCGVYVKTMVRVVGNVVKHQNMFNIRYIVNENSSSMKMVARLLALIKNNTSYDKAYGLKNVTEIAELLRQAAESEDLSGTRDLEAYKQRKNFELYKAERAKTLTPDLKKVFGVFANAYDALKKKNVNINVGFNGTSEESFIRAYSNICKLSIDDQSKLLACIHSSINKKEDGTFVLSRNQGIIGMTEAQDAYIVACKAVADVDSVALHSCMLPTDVISYGTVDASQQNRKCNKCNTLYASHLSAEMCRLRCYLKYTLNQLKKSGM